MYPTPPDVIGGRYRPLRLLARGGAGSVYEAEHLHTGARVALKLLTGFEGASPAAVSRFRAEARTAASIVSEHVVRITDAGTAEEFGATPFLVMELLHGRTLEQEASAPMAPAVVVEVLTQVARGLEKAHALGIIHRDLKPDNVFVSARDDGSMLVKLLDFGIAKRVSPVHGEVATEQGALLGTPMYMSPEQAHGQRNLIDERTDTWAIGLIAFRLLSGRPYFPPDVVPRMLFRILFGPILPPSAVGCSASPAFDAWFLRSCSRDLEQRFSSPSEQVAALKLALEGVATVDIDHSLDPHGVRPGPTLDGDALLRTASASLQAMATAAKPTTGSGDKCELAKGPLSGPHEGASDIVSQTHFTAQRRMRRRTLVAVSAALCLLFAAVALRHAATGVPSSRAAPPAAQSPATAARSLSVPAVGLVPAVALKEREGLPLSQRPLQSDAALQHEPGRSRAEPQSRAELGAVPALTGDGGTPLRRSKRKLPAPYDPLGDQR